jgi:hypothetical protein
MTARQQHCVCFRVRFTSSVNRMPTGEERGVGEGSCRGICPPALKTGKRQQRAWRRREMPWSRGCGAPGAEADCRLSWSSPSTPRRKRAIRGSITSSGTWGAISAQTPRSRLRTYASERTLSVMRPEHDHPSSGSEKGRRAAPVPGGESVRPHNLRPMRDLVALVLVDETPPVHGTPSVIRELAGPHRQLCGRKSLPRGRRPVLSRRAEPAHTAYERVPLRTILTDPRCRRPARPAFAPADATHRPPGR